MRVCLYGYDIQKSKKNALSGRVHSESVITRHAIVFRQILANPASRSFAGHKGCLRLFLCPNQNDAQKSVCISGIDRVSVILVLLMKGTEFQHGNAFVHNGNHYAFFAMGFLSDKGPHVVDNTVRFFFRERKAFFCIGQRQYRVTGQMRCLLCL